MCVFNKRTCTFSLVLPWRYVCMYMHESGFVRFLTVKTFSVGSAINNSNCSTRSVSILFVPLPAGIWCPATITFALLSRHITPDAGRHVTLQLSTNNSSVAAGDQMTRGFVTLWCTVRNALMCAFAIPTKQINKTNAHTCTSITGGFFFFFTCNGQKVQPV